VVAGVSVAPKRRPSRGGGGSVGGRGGGGAAAAAAVSETATATAPRATVEEPVAVGVAAGVTWAAGTEGVAGVVGVAGGEAVVARVDGASSRAAASRGVIGQGPERGCERRQGWVDGPPGR